MPRLMLSETAVYEIRMHGGVRGGNREEPPYSIVTDFSAIGGCVRADVGTSTAPINSANGSILRGIGRSSSGRDNRGRFYDVAHEPGRIPIGLGGLRHAIAVGAANHKRMVALCR